MQWQKTRMIKIKFTIKKANKKYQIVSILRFLGWILNFLEMIKNFKLLQRNRTFSLFLKIFTSKISSKWKKWEINLKIKVLKRTKFQIITFKIQDNCKIKAKYFKGYLFTFLKGKVSWQLIKLNQIKEFLLK